MHTELEWDPEKAIANYRKHGVHFEEAASALLDPQALSMEDADSLGELRWILVGMSSAARLLTVVYALPDENRIRIISARKSTWSEATFYA
jgi:uncharacterized DUF497 family protein